MKGIRHILAIVGRIVFIGLSIQIVLGLLWMCCVFTEVQQFGESIFYIEASKSLLCDEYTGALYPVLLVLARGIEELLPIPHTYIVYLIQLGVAVFAGYRFLEAAAMKLSRGNTGKEKLCMLWGSLGLLTFPMAMQCHMAILPNSLVSSCFLLEMSFLIKAIRSREAFQAADLAKACTGWLLASLLLPDYLFLGAVPLLLVFLCEMFCEGLQKGRKRILSICYHGILIAAFAGMIVGANSLTQVEGCYDRPRKTVNAALFRRVAWTSLQNYYEAWPQDMKDCFTLEEVASIAAYADNMERMLQPRMEAELGVERADELYRELGTTIWRNNTAKIIHQTAWDVVGYTLPPVTVQLFLTGRGYDSYVGRNYDIMRQEAPGLTRCYMNYGCWWFSVGLGIMALIVLGKLINAGLAKRQRNGIATSQNNLSDVCQKSVFWKKVFLLALCVVSAGCMVVWYALQGAGMWDYKNALFVGQLWLSGMIVLMERI